ncbi:MAG TPA: immunoglobulin domain-containing protein, partial [Opitutaceae bacterium]|nr:immunoglobulin domain-containing protein [Opitutaceae bacterium]
MTGGTVTLTVQGTGSSVFTYQWFKDGVSIPGATSANLTLSPIQLAQAGIYTVTMRNAFGMVTSDGAMVIVENE